MPFSGAAQHYLDRPRETALACIGSVLFICVRVDPSVAILLSWQELPLWRKNGSQIVRLRSQSHKIRRSCNTASRPKKVGGAPDSAAAATEDVRVSHGRLQVLMAEQLLIPSKYGTPATVASSTAFPRSGMADDFLWSLPRAGSRPPLRARGGRGPPDLG